MEKNQKLTSSKRGILKVLSNVVFFLLGVMILIYAFKDLDGGQVLDQAIQANYGWIVVGKLFGLTAHWLRGLRWRILLQPIGYTPSAMTLMIGYDLLKRRLPVFRG